MPEYTVSVENTFEADSDEEAVIQMVEWLQEAAAHTTYRVGLAGSAAIEVIDADDIYA